MVPARLGQTDSRPNGWETIVRALLAGTRIATDQSERPSAFSATAYGARHDKEDVIITHGPLGLTPRTAVVFMLLMAIGVCIWAYAWRVGTDTSWLEDGSSPPPTLPTPAAVTIPLCASPGPAVSPADAPVYAADRFSIGAGGASGLAYHSEDRSLLIGRSGEDVVHLESFTLFGDRVGSRSVDISAVDDLAWDRGSRTSLFSLDISGTMVDVILLTPGASETVASSVIDLRAAGVRRASGLGMDQSTSSMVLVDSALDRLLRVDVPELQRSAQRPWQVTVACDLPLPVLRDADKVVVAVRSESGAIFMAEAGDRVLYEIEPNGAATFSYDLSSIGITAVRGLAFAPSPNPADGEAVEYLYVLDDQPGRAGISAVTFEPADSAEVATSTAVVVQAIDLSGLDPPSSDPGGVAYEQVADRVIVTDSDIDENSEFGGSVAFARGADGSWDGLGIPAQLHEVTDVALDPAGNRWFFSDDGRDIVIIFDLGPDRRFGTRDDEARQIATTSYGIIDPEGLAFGQGSLFVADGAGSKIYRLMTGPDGRYAGVSDRTDDSVTSFDTSVHGVSDPEGIAFDPSRGTLYVLGRDNKELILEVGTDGRLIRRIIVPRGALVSPGGIALMPSGASESLRLLIADRGADNARSANPNDGRLVELEVPPP